MQISFNPNTTTFKGSFKNVNMDDFLPECDNWQRKQVAPITVYEEPPMLTRKSMMKSFSYKEGEARTDINLWESEKEVINDKIPENIKNLCKFHGINPKEDLFMISGINKDGQLFVVFNSFFRNQKVYEIPKKNNSKEKEKIVRYVDCEQVYCLKSNDINPTPLQIDVAQIFCDSRNKRYLIDGNLKNPLQSICDPGVNAKEIFSPAIHALSSISRQRPLDELINNKGRFNKVIYSADGEYTRYRIAFLPVK